MVEVLIFWAAGDGFKGCWAEDRIPRTVAGVLRERGIPTICEEIKCHSSRKDSGVRQMIVHLPTDVIVTTEGDMSPEETIASKLKLELSLWGVLGEKDEVIVYRDILPWKD